jgi:hypothetical protein
MSIPKEKEVYFQKIILNLIRVSEDFKSILQSEFPNIYADIQSASTNPNCSCVRKVEAELLSNKDKALNLLNIDYASLAPKLYSGRMFVIENTEEKFKEFMDFINQDRAQFRNFSTAISPEGKLHIYFL